MLAALLLAAPAGAQEAGDNPFAGGLELEPPLDPLGLYSETTTGLSGFYGSDNLASIVQDGLSNRAEIRQTGSDYGALTTVMQYGSGNIAGVDQCACGNLADVLQQGDGNVSGVTQTGAGNVIVHRQYGDGLALSVTQYGGARVAITQSRP